MVSINLLPEQQAVAQTGGQKKALIVTLLIAINAGLIGLTVVLFLVGQTQSLVIKRTTSDISNKQAQFAAVPNVVDMVTLQNNLKALPGLYENRKIYSRYMTIIESATPAAVGISAMSVGQDGTVTIAGTARSYRLAAKYVAALQASNTNNTPNFTNVDLKSVNGQGAVVTFNITALMSPTVVSVGGGQ